MLHTLNLTRCVARATALLAVITVAACSDAPTSAPLAVDNLTPNPALVGRVPEATLTLAVRDRKTKAIVGGTTVAFTSGNGAPVNVVDNGPGDGDRRPGYFAVTMPRSSSYKAIVVSTIPKYDLHGPTVQVNSSAASVNMGTDSLWTNPLFMVYVYADDTHSMLLPGATFTANAFNTTFGSFKDGDVNDMMFIGGIVEFYGTGASSTIICETVAPQGYKLANPDCLSVPAAWDMVIKVAFDSHGKLTRM